MNAAAVPREIQGEDASRIAEGVSGECIRCCADAVECVEDCRVELTTNASGTLFALIMVVATVYLFSAVGFGSTPDSDPAGKGITNMQMQAIPPDFGKMPRGGGFSNSRLRAVTSPPSKTKRKLSSSADWTISNLTAALGLKAAHTITPSIDRQGFLHFDPDAPSAGKPTIIHTTSRTTCLAPGQANILKKWLSVPIAAGPVEVWVWTDTGIKGWIDANLKESSPVLKAVVRTQQEWTTTYKSDGSVAWNATRWHGVYLADIIRYLAVYTYGGVYIDSDVEPVQPFDAVMDACPTALFWEPRVYRGGARWGEHAPKGLLNIAILIAKEAGSPAIGEVLLRVVERLNALPASATKRPNPVYSTGPNPAAKALYSLKEGKSLFTALKFASNRNYFSRALGAQMHAGSVNMEDVAANSNANASLSRVDQSKASAAAAAAAAASLTGTGGGGGGNPDANHLMVPPAASAVVTDPNVVCEIDHPDSDLLFEHRFFCTYCDRGPKHNRADREKLTFESALEGPQMKVVYPLVPLKESCKGV